MEYKPFKPFLIWLYELYIHFSLRIAGYDLDLAKSVLGYKPKDVPFIYGTDPLSCNGDTLISELWMGSTVSKDKLIGDWDDQIPEVIVQWWGNTPVKNGSRGKRKVSRLEVHHLSDGSFVQLEFRNVSDMGAFDGGLHSLSYYKPKEDFFPGGKRRKEFSIHIIHQKGVRWTVNLGRSNLSGTAMLNAWQQIKQFRMKSVYVIKPDSGK